MNMCKPAFTLPITGTRTPRTSALNKNNFSGEASQWKNFVQLCTLKLRAADVIGW